MTQKQAVLKYMRKYGSITPMQAFKRLGITKLATRVSELRQDGVEIAKETVQVKTRYGKTMVKKYSLKETENV